MSECRQDLGVTLKARHMRLQEGASVSPRGAARFLVFVVLSLTVLSLLGQVAVHRLPDFLLRDRFAAAFNVDGEGNIPALYSALAILSCAYLLWVIARVEREASGRFSWQWTLMSITFLGLACDEFLGFHELLSGYADLSSITLFSWVAFGMGFVFIFALIFFRMVVQLPSPTRRLFILAGLIYLSGAIGVEALTGHFVPVWGDQGMKYVFCAATEELLEMLGIVVFIYALLTYLVQGRREVSLALELHVYQDLGAKHLAADRRGGKRGPYDAKPPQRLRARS
jgi:hypothetical protein